MSAWHVMSPVTVQLKQCIPLLLEDSTGRRTAAHPMPSHLKEFLQLKRNSLFSSVIYHLRSAGNAKDKTLSRTTKVTQGLLES